MIICACRTSGKTKKKVEALKGNGYRIIWASNYSCSDNNLHITLNNLYAEGVIEMIDLILKGKMQESPNR